MISRSGLSERGFSRRFQTATGHAPLDYVQHLRVEQAKRRLERSDQPIEQVACAVGYRILQLFAACSRGSPGSAPAGTAGNSRSL
jgi:transcriptional regulator GlxA family with amidase domain